jgi:hypothetical protein
MRALSASGNRAQALRSYDAFRRELAAELGVTPSRATEQLFVELLADERAPADPRMAARVSAVAGGPLLLAPAAPPSAVSEQRLEELVGRLAGTPAGSRMAVVSGGQGSGKTRLAADFAALALARGLPVLYGREDPSLPAPLSGILSPLAAALGTLAPGAVDTLMRAAPGPLAVLGADPIDPAAGLAAPRLGLAESSLSAIVESLELIAGDRGALLVLDDAQTASAATVEVLATLLEDHAELALTTVVLLRDPAASDPLQQLRDHPRVVSFALSSTH